MRAKAPTSPSTTFPTEEPDASEVIALIKAEGRIGVAIPGDLRDEEFCQELVDRAVERSRRPRHPGQQCRPPADTRLDPRYHDRGFRRDDEDQHLRAVLDHQGGAAASEARLRHHRHDVGAGLRSVARSLRLRADQGGDDELRQVAGQAAWRQRASASTAWRPDRSGRRCRSPAARPWRSSRSSAARRRSAAPASPPSSARSMCSLPRPTPAYATGQVYGAAGGSGQP